MYGCEERCEAVFWPLSGKNNINLNNYVKVMVFLNFPPKMWEPCIVLWHNIQDYTGLYLGVGRLMTSD